MTEYIAFVCGHNSGRSQIAMALFNSLKKIHPSVYARYEAVSWGTAIGSRINPRIIRPLKAAGIDLTDGSVYFPKDITHPSLRDKLGKVTRVYTMGCMDNACELPPQVPVKPENVGDWGLDDPAKPGTDVVAVRDKIIGKCMELIVELKEDKLS